MMGLEFLNLVRKGKNSWWRYLLSLVLFISGVLGAGIVATTALMFRVNTDNDPNTYINMKDGQVIGIAPAIVFAISMVGFIGLALMLFISMRLIHQRSFLSLVTPRQRFDWKRFWQGFGFLMALDLAASLIEATLYPGRYQVTFNPGAFFRFLPFVLVLVPIQAASEELLFRGYLQQSLGLLTTRFLFPALGSSLLFMLLHFANPELDAGAVLTLAYYFGMGFLLSLVTLKDNRLELALGAHVAINLFAALFANYANSALPTPAIFTSNTLDATFNFVIFVIMAVIFYLGFFWRQKSVRQGAGRRSAHH